MRNWKVEKWKVENDGEANFAGISSNDDWLMRIQQNGELLAQEQKENMNLIAASPQLLDAALKVYTAFRNGIRSNDEICMTIGIAESIGNDLEEALCSAITDLFEVPDLIPHDVNLLIEKCFANGNDYESCARLKKN